MRGSSPTRTRLQGRAMGLADNRDCWSRAVPDTQQTWKETDMFSSILIAYDDSPGARRALELALDIGEYDRTPIMTAVAVESHRHGSVERSMSTKPSRTSTTNDAPSGYGQRKRSRHRSGSN